MRRPSANDLAASRQRLEEASALERERDELIRNVLGVEFRDFVAIYVRRQEPWGGTLSLVPDPERRRRAEEVLTRYDDLERGVIEASGGTLGANDEATLKTLFQKKVAELRGTLSPTELEEFEVRTSPVANELRSRLLIGFDPTEEEFRSIFRIYNGTDQSITAQPGSVGEHAQSFAAIQTRDEKIREVLGEQRYVEYVRSQDQTFQRLVETTDYLGLPTTAAVQVYEAREQVLAKVREMDATPGLSPEQRLVTLQAIRAETEQEVIAALGQGGFRRYVGAPWGQWLNDIVH